MLNNTSGKEFVQIRCVVLGDCAVGKTTIVNNILTDADDSGLPRLGGCYLSRGDVDFKLEIWDTCEGESYENITRVACKGSQICICVFDVTDDSTYASLDTHIKLYKKLNSGKNCQIVVIANKVDKNDWAANNEIYYSGLSEYDLYFTSKNSDQKELMTTICAKYHEKFATSVIKPTKSGFLSFFVGKRK
jgi:small GTP-binding protein